MKKTSELTLNELSEILHIDVVEAIVIRAYSHISINHLKVEAQKLREDLDWTFDSDKQFVYDTIMKMINKYEVFQTEFVPSL